MVTWPSGKARVCKTLIHQFKSGRHLQKIPGSFGFRDFLFLSSLILEKRSSAHFCGIAGGFARWQQQRLAGAERHGGGLCAAEKRPPLPCLRLPGQPDAARKGHCRVYRLLPQTPNQIKAKRSEPCTIQDSDRSDCQILIFIQLSGFASCIRFTKFCAAPAQGRRSRWAWTKSRSCRFPARCGDPRQRRWRSWQGSAALPAQGRPVRGSSGWRYSHP